MLPSQDPSSVMRQDGSLGELKKALLNRLMAAEFGSAQEDLLAAGFWRRGAELVREAAHLIAIQQCDRANANRDFRPIGHSGRLGDVALIT